MIMQLVVCVITLTFAFQGIQADFMEELKGLIDDTFEKDGQPISNYLMQYTNGTISDKCGKNTKQSEEEMKSCLSAIEDVIQQLSVNGEELLHRFHDKFCPIKAEYERPAMYISYKNGDEAGVVLFNKSADGLQISDKVLTASEPYYIMTDKSGNFMITIEKDVAENGTILSSSIALYKRSRCDGKFKLLYAVPTAADLYSLTMDITEQYLITGDSVSGYIFSGLLGAAIYEPSELWIPIGGVASRKLCPHKVSFHPTRKNILVMAYACWDKVLMVRFDSNSGRFSKIYKGAKFVEGTAPSEYVFSKDTNVMYVIGTMSHNVTVVVIDQDEFEIGGFYIVQEIRSVPESEVKNTVYNSKLVMHPEGKFLYAINTGFGSVTMYKVNTTSGKLNLIGYQPAGGKSLTGIDISPIGDQLVVTDRDSNIIVIFNIDPITGQLPISKTITNVKNPRYISYPVSYIAPGKKSSD